MKIAIGCDHAALEMKEEFKKVMEGMGLEVTDKGTYTADSCDYPDIAEAVCLEVTKGDCDRGILICGTGIGMSIAANKVKGIRAALINDSFGAKYTRLHNDTNVACFGARTTGIGLATELLQIFLTTEYEGGRHQKRVDKITALEEKN